MKKALLLFSLCPLLSFSQVNSFEGFSDMDLFIDTTLVNNIWQIGPPQKAIFDSAYSTPNVIVTDTVGSYPVANYSVFQFRVDMNTLFAFPFFVITWKQKIDTEFKIDGGWIEVSYDTGATWANVFTDTVYKPDIVTGATIDTLANGEVGFTGTDSTWTDVMLCWSNGMGFPPFPINNVMDIRFIFWSDTTMQVNPHEGWMIDNIWALATVIDNVSENTTSNNFNIFPNPAQNVLNFEFDLNNDAYIEIEVIDIQNRFSKIINSEKRKSGKNIITTSVSELNISKGIYFVRIKTDNKLISYKTGNNKLIYLEK
ncbi:MAG: T9SS type A sorting domain-containing protein [Bacteroidia bacterium]